MKKLFYGWWIVIASSALTTFNGGMLFYGFTAFFNPILKEFGWTRAATSLAFSLQRLEGGIIAPIAGYFIDRLGPRKMSLFAVFLFGLGFVMLSRIQSLLDFYIAFMVASIGHSAGFYAVGAAVVSSWFVRKRGKAMGFVTGGVCTAGFLLPVIVWLIDTYGWRNSLVVAGVSMWVIGFPLSLVFRSKPEAYGMLPDGDSPPHEPGPVHKEDPESKPQPPGALTANHPPENHRSKGTGYQPPVVEKDFTTREALKTRSFWFLSLGWSMSMLAMSAVFVHVMPFLESIGVSREKAGWIITVIILISVTGRVGLGWLSDYMDKRHVFCVALALQVVGLLVFANIHSIWHIVLFLITFSPGYGGPIPLRAAIQGEYFGRKHFGTIQGMFLAVSTVCAMIGPPFAGWICDITGSYRLAFLILAVIPAIGIPLFLLTPPPGREPPR